MRDIPEDVAQLRKQRHRDAQARYRETNRIALRVQSWQYRSVLALSLWRCKFSELKPWVDVQKSSKRLAKRMNSNIKRSWPPSRVNFSDTSIRKFACIRQR